MSSPRPECEGGEDPCLWSIGRFGPGHPLNSCCRSASRGHLACLRYAHENGCRWNEETCRLASQNGHLDCLRYAHENGCPWNEDTTRLASHVGHLECLRYAHENGCPWDTRTCSEACARDQLECLRYAHTHGCHWDEYTIKWALGYGGYDCLLYALDEGCPRPDFTVLWVSSWSVPHLYHRGITLSKDNSYNLRDHIRQHVRQAKTLLRCAVILLGAYRRACERVYAPDGIGYREAELSFRGAVRLSGDGSRC